MKNDTKSAQKQALILNVGLNSTSPDKVLASVRGFLAQSYKFTIFTPNPEIVLLAQKDKKFREVLNSADINIPDGVGLIMAGKFLGMSKSANSITKIPLYLLQGLLTGLSVFINQNWLYSEIRPIKEREMFLDLIKLANKKGWKVFLFGGEGNEAKETGVFLGKTFKSIKIRSAQGPMLDNQGQPISERDIKIQSDMIDEINSFAPQLLFVACNAPKQEKWIYQNLKRLKVGGAMAVGGTYNYLSGKSLLPPVWMEKLGLEWLWRLIKEPYRLGRIINAVVVFPFRVFSFKLKS